MTDDAASTEVPQPSPRRWVRGVRIGASVFFGMLTLLLVVLWLRSYSEPIHLRGTLVGYQYFSMYSFHGLATFNVASSDVAWMTDFGWDVAKQHQRNVFVKPNRDACFVIDTDNAPKSVVLRAPHWILSLCSAMIAIAPWLSLRFSLRTMLIATTLVAVVLGALVWAAAE
jgi:hypothetical protein